MAEEEKKEESGQETNQAPEDSSSKNGAAAPQDENSNDEKEVEIPEKFKGIVEQIEQMPVMDLSELVKILEDKFGVSAAAPVMSAPSEGAGSGSEEASEEKDSFDVELTGAGDNKISVIKAVREVTELGLKEAKDLVDGVPQAVKEGVKKEEAEEMKSKLEEAGAQVTLK